MWCARPTRRRSPTSTITAYFFLRRTIHLWNDVVRYARRPDGGEPMKPRDFITLLGGAATWPMVPRDQQADRMRRVGVLMGGVTEVDAVAKAQLVAFAQGLRALGWTEARNLRIDYRWPVGDIKRMQTDARRRNSMLSSSGPRIAMQSWEGDFRIPANETRGTPPTSKRRFGHACRFPNYLNLSIGLSNQGICDQFCSDTVDFHRNSLRVCPRPVRCPDGPRLMMSERTARCAQA